MIDVKTPLSILHRPARWTAKGFIGRTGLWAYVSSRGVLTNIATDSTSQRQPKILKFLFNEADDTALYLRNDTKIRRIATLEGIFRASVDGEGYQVYDTILDPVVYSGGDALTPAYRITNLPTTDPRYSDPEDIGKLRPATGGDLVVARVEKFDSVNGILDFITVTPYRFGQDDMWGHEGIGHLSGFIGTAEGEGNDVSFLLGVGDLSPHAAQISGRSSISVDGEGVIHGHSSTIAGRGLDVSYLIGSGSLIGSAAEISGSGSDVSELVGAGDLSSHVAEISGNDSDTSELIGAGTLLSSVAQISSTASISVDAIGVLVGVAATMVGTGIWRLNHIGVGDLLNIAPTMAGEGVHTLNYIGIGDLLDIVPTMAGEGAQSGPPAPDRGAYEYSPLN
jgi:hypothetical protein